MELKDVNTWEDYEEYVRTTHPRGQEMIDRAERVAKSVSNAMEALREINMEIAIFDADEVPDWDSLPVKNKEQESAQKINWPQRCKPAIISRKPRAHSSRLQRA